jgi:hypothetical protein
MKEQIILSKIYMLSSDSLRSELIDYLDFLLTKQFSEKQPNKKRKPKFGCAKGKFIISDDFDAPLDEFKEYMPE